MSNPSVAIVMGSQSDWPTMEHSAQTLKELGIEYHAQVISAHRTPDLLFEFANEAPEMGIKVIIAGAGGAAHLPGMLASKTHLPIIGVPIESKSLKGMDSLLSIVQMPGGIPVGTVAIGKAGAINSALYAASILATHDETIAQKLKDFRAQQTERVLSNLQVE